MLGETIKIKGTVTGDENLIVEGTIEGNVELPKNDLTVGTSGKVTADISANTVRVDGQVVGDINGTEKVIISRSGKVQGNIKAPRVTLEDGAKFKGSIDMDPGEETVNKPVAAAPAPDSSPAAKQAC
ncbi:MAG: polymer-forming cytoskeletal protein [Pseudomonadota bacterium]